MYKVRRLAVHNGSHFEVVDGITLGHGDDHAYVDLLDIDPTERHMVLYYPVDPRMIPLDVSGATRSYPNEDNTGWLFAHTDEGTHHDYELTLLAAVDGVMQPLFRQYQVDVWIGSSNEVKRKGQELHILLSQFYGAVVTEARKRARSAYLGLRHQEPHPRTGYLDADITASITTVKEKWATMRAGDLVKLGPALGYIERTLNMPTPETRWDQAKRIIEEETPKVIKPIADTQIVISGSVMRFDLEQVFSDNDASLRYAVEGNSDPAVISVAINGVHLEVTPLTVGTATVTVRATDPNDLFVEDVFNVAVVSG